jgi:hypothetical protein
LIDEANEDEEDDEDLMMEAAITGMLMERYQTITQANAE